MPSHHQVGNFQNEAGSDFLFGVQMNLGGRSLFWSGLIPRMHNWELNSWPTPVRDLLTNGGYDAAEKLMRVIGRIECSQWRAEFAAGGEGSRG